MIKLCDQSLVKLLPLILMGRIESGVYPDIWKKSNLAPEHKKDDKLNNYRPVSLLQICSKVPGKLITN